MTRPTPTYSEREQSLLRELAARTVADPASSHADVEAATRRLVAVEPSVQQVRERLSLAEIETWRALNAKLDGRPSRFAIRVVVDGLQVCPRCARDSVDVTAFSIDERHTIRVAIARLAAEKESRDSDPATDRPTPPSAARELAAGDVIDADCAEHREP